MSVGDLSESFHVNAKLDRRSIRFGRAGHKLRAQRRRLAVQWRGPDRDGISKETGLLHEWPAAGPSLVWQLTDVGNGYSTPSIAEGRIYLLGNQGMDDEFVQASQ